MQYANIPAATSPTEPVNRILSVTGLSATKHVQHQPVMEHSQQRRTCSHAAATKEPYGWNSPPQPTASKLISGCARDMHCTLVALSRTAGRMHQVAMSMRCSTTACRLLVSTTYTKLAYTMSSPNQANHKPANTSHAWSTASSATNRHADAANEPYCCNRTTPPRRLPPTAAERCCPPA